MKPMLVRIAHRIGWILFKKYSASKRN